MSVLIKGMEMPKNCRECRFGYDGKCFAEQPFHRFFMGDTHKCPLIELPPHGRLIDADALMEDAQHKGKYDVVNAYDIANAPTILEAEVESK